MLYAAAYGQTIPDIPRSPIDTGIVSKETETELYSAFARIRGGEARVAVSLLIHVNENVYQWFECNASVIFDADGNPDHAVLVSHNITEQRVKEAVFRKWQQLIEKRPPESYTLFCCNLSRDASLDERDGTLLGIKFPKDSDSFNSRTAEYAQRYVYPEDRKSYTAILNSDTLLAMFYRGA